MDATFFTLENTFTKLSDWFESSSVSKSNIFPNTKKISEQTDTKKFAEIDLSNARFYSMSNNMIEENIFNFTKADINPAEIILQTTRLADIIIVLTGKETGVELNYLFQQFKNRIYAIIHPKKFNLEVDYPKRVEQIIETPTFKQAVNEAYRIIKNQQTIFFLKTDSFFDFFSYISY